jgi:vacuolar-type H+-ATPase subunit H
LLAEVIKSIRETEGKAEETRRNAQAGSRRIIQEAKQHAAKLVRRSVTEAETKRREILARAEDEFQKKVIPGRERSAVGVVQLRQKALALPRAAP